MKHYAATLLTDDSGQYLIELCIGGCTDRTWLGRRTDRSHQHHWERSTA